MLSGEEVVERLNVGNRNRTVGGGGSGGRGGGRGAVTHPPRDRHKTPLSDNLDLRESTLLRASFASLVAPASLE
eukprot:scaffold835_cov133-Cylindrotheca_fusiformis.AAC.3